MLELDSLLVSLGITEGFDKSNFVSSIQIYIQTIINNIINRFPQPKVVTLMGYLDPRNVDKATPVVVMELADLFLLDKAKFWQEYLLYKPLAQSIQISEDQTAIEKIVEVVLDPGNGETMAECFPLISDMLSRLSVLPVSSAQAERLFSAMNRIKTAQRNRLKPVTLNHLIRVSTEGPPFTEWDPIPAMKVWESKGPHKISTSL